jgi:TMEM175 potassium channel family protein
MTISEDSREKKLERGLTTNRIESLSDGVFAIVLTLMVFQIRVPDIPLPQAPHDLWNHLMHQAPEFYSYAVSFILVGIYWVAHHNMYHLVKRSTRPLLWMNLVFLMFVGFVPYSVALVGRYADIQRVMIIYGVHLMIISGLLFLQWWYVTRQKNLLVTPLNKEFVRSVDIKILQAPAVCVLAILTSFVSVRGSYLLYLLTIVMYLLPSHMDKFWTET